MMEQETVQPQPREALNLLRRELALQKRHLQLVKEQNSALIAGDRARFERLHRAYVRFVTELDAQCSDRTKTFGCSMTPIILLFYGWSGAERSAGVALATAVHQVLAEIQDVVNQNNTLIGNELRYIEFMLDTYIEAGRKTNGYARQGLFPRRTEHLLLNKCA